MRIVFLGSPAAVLPVVQSLQEQAGKNPSHRLVGIVSQPAKPSGRGRHLLDPAVAVWGKTTDVPVFQFSNINDPENLKHLRDLQPDLCVTAAYGQILGDDFLLVPTRGTINIHPSLLPKYRGATPVASAILAGEKETGVSILFTVKKLDAGNIIAQEAFPLLYDKGAMALTEELFRLSVPLLMLSIDKLATDADFLGHPQDEKLVSQGKKIKKEDGAIDWSHSASLIFRKSLAYDPWPGIYTVFKGSRIVVSRCFLPKKDDLVRPEGFHDIGRFYFSKKLKALIVACGSDFLACQEVKPEGQRKMDAQSFFNGIKDKSELCFSL